MDAELKFELDLTPYEPAAIYLADSDSLEYVRRDTQTVHRRVDEVLTLILEMNSREIIGFKLKGTENFFIRSLSKSEEFSDSEFGSLVKVMEVVVSKLGNSIFAERDRNLAYRNAIDIARADNVRLPPNCRVA